LCSPSTDCRTAWWSSMKRPRVLPKNLPRNIPRRTIRDLSWARSAPEPNFRRLGISVLMSSRHPTRNNIKGSSRAGWTAS